MKFQMLTSCLIVCCLLLSSAIAQDKPQATKVEGDIGWVFNYEEGLKLSKESDKPVFLVFRCER